MIRFIKHYFKMVLATVLCALAATSCQDDLWFGDGATEEGLPATLTFSVQVGDMDVKTRSIIDEDARNYCNDVWVGIYLESTGKCIYNHYYSKETMGRQEVSKLDYGLYEFTVTTESGDARMVAVANVDNEMGSTTPDAKRDSLRNVLAAADTWTKYKQIAVHKDNVGDANVRTGTLMMSGAFEYADSNGKQKDDEGYSIVSIQKGDNKLTNGSIHLHRLTSYNKVNISAGDNITMTVNTWKVCNIPTDSYLADLGDTINAGTTIQKDKSPYGDSPETHLFSKNGETCSFEFYMYENKHIACQYEVPEDDTDYVGISDDDPYGDREREYKNTDGTNTGIYRSLVADRNDTLSMKNNNASYIVFTADLDYYIDMKYKDDPGHAEPVAYDATQQQIHRTATATYVVHLGYIGNDTLSKEKDFICNRDTRYTYNIKVLGANKLVLEAKNNGEYLPGYEGSVFDDYGEYVPMDAHYCVYNIALTNEERSKLSYRVSSPYNGTTYTFDSGDYKKVDSKGKTLGSSWEENQLFTWIKFKPTTSKDVLAKYKENENDNTLWSLDDLRDVPGHPWAEWTIADDGTLTTANIDNLESSTTEHYYTVFVDEYVYHYYLNGTHEGDKESLWYTYVNQDDRVAQLYLNLDYSTDGESDYTYCKYAFAQKSIQTYYKYNINEPEDEVMGVEHTDENYGLNYDWYYVTRKTGYGTEDKDYLSANNGRWNLDVCLDTMEARNVFTREWKNYVSSNTPDNITAGYNTYYDVSHEAASYPVPKLAALGGSRNSTYHWSNDNQVHYMNVACMNRNRDLNGDGKITQDELRWYLPTGSEYVQLSLCQTELRTPLIALLQHRNDEFAKTGETDRTLIKRMTPYHYATSNNMYFWAEEIGSLGDRPFGSVPEKQMCYALRCMRNLGANPATAPNKDGEIVKPYNYDSGTLTFSQDRFSDISLRSYVGTYILPHDVGSETNRPYKKFKMAKKYCSNIQDDSIYVDGSGVVQWINAADEGTKTYRWYQSLLHNGICGQYYENSDASDKGTWRVPTLTELGIMNTEGVLGSVYQLSCSRNHFLVFNGTCGYTAGYTDAFPYEFLGFHGGEKLIKKSVMMNAPGSIHVRCIKDVKE